MQNSSQSNQNTIFEWLKFIPLVIFAGIAPLIVHLKVLSYPELAENLWLPSGFKVNDIFNYYKAQTILFSGVLAVIGLIIHYVFKGFKWRRDYLAVLTLGVFVAISATLSVHSSVAWSGYPEKMQGGLMWLTYLVMIIYISQVLVSNVDHIRMLRIIQISGIIVVGIGVFQTLGMDFFRSELGARVILGGNLYEKFSSDVINFSFGEHQAYGTLYNPNFVGSYVSMLFPLSIYGYFKDENRVLKIVWGLLGVGAIVMLVGSQSRAGLFGLGAVLFSLVLWMLMKGRKHAKHGIIGIVIILTLGVGINAITGAAYSSKLLQSFKTAQTSADVQKIALNDHEIHLELSDGKTIVATYEVKEGEVHSEFVDEDGDTYTIKLDSEGYYHIDGIDILRFAFGEVSDVQFLTFDINGSRWDFAYQEDGVKFINPVGRLSGIITTESGSWAGLETMGSNRGYIWSRALRIAKTTAFIGKGPDSFALEFPQTDYVNKENLYQSRSIVVDKAHNGYIGMAIELGWMAILIFTALQVRLIIKGFSQGREGVFLSLALIGIGITNVFNDFNIHTMFLHVVVMGMLIATLFEMKSENMGA